MKPRCPLHIGIVIGVTLEAACGPLFSEGPILFGRFLDGAEVPRGSESTP